MDSRQLQGTDYYVARIKELESESLMHKVALERSRRREQSLCETLEGFKELLQKHLARQHEDAAAALQQQNELEAVTGKLDALLSENQSLRAQVSQLQLLLTSAQTAQLNADPMNTAMQGGSVTCVPEVERLTLLLQERTKALHEAYNIIAAGSTAVPRGGHQRLHEAEGFDRGGPRPPEGPSPQFLAQQNTALSLRVAELEQQLYERNMDSRFGL